MVTEAERLNLHLDQHPEDLELRLVLSDLYEEIDELEKAKVQHWMVKERKWPLDYPPGSDSLYRKWAWIDYDPMVKKYNHASLKGPQFSSLFAGSKEVWRVARFSTRQEAEAALEQCMEGRDVPQEENSPAAS